MMLGAQALGVLALGELSTEPAAATLTLTLASARAHTGNVIAARGRAATVVGTVTAAQPTVRAS